MNFVFAVSSGKNASSVNFQACTSCIDEEFINTVLTENSLAASQGFPAFFREVRLKPEHAMDTCRAYSKHPFGRALSY